ncbi:MAG: Si-specific NAD(P)(+) transhydrogenase [Parachlamydiales bacterium]
MKQYELVVIGSGPAGEKAAVKAAYFGHSVALIEQQPVFGGAGVQTGTLPSKTLKETALYLSGKSERGLYGIERKLEHKASVEDFLFRKDRVVETYANKVHRNIELHGVDIIQGTASFQDPHTIHVKGAMEQTVRGEYILIATGSYPVHPSGIPFDSKRVHDSNSILEITRFPTSICVVGAGVIGCEYATIFATMGCKVYLINRSDKILSHLDHDVVEELLCEMRNEGIEILFNTTIKEIKVPHGEQEPLDIALESGETLLVDMYLFAAGRNGCIHDLELDRAGVKVGKRELIEVDGTYRTSVPHIYAAGDVIGFPALASTSMDQGRAAVAHMFQTHDLENIATVLPYGIYTIPEVSIVGMTLVEAKEKGIDALEGVAHHKDMARGQIMGAKHGFLKLVFSRDDLVVHGVHVIGPLATELVHYGGLLIQDKKTLMDVIAMVFNHPTLHDLYKYAAYDGLSTLTGKRVRS